MDLSDRLKTIWHNEEKRIKRIYAVLKDIKGSPEEGHVENNQQNTFLSAHVFYNWVGKVFCKAVTGEGCHPFEYRDDQWSFSEKALRSTVDTLASIKRNTPRLPAEVAQDLDTLMEIMKPVALEQRFHLEPNLAPSERRREIEEWLPTGSSSAVIVQTMQEAGATVQSEPGSISCHWFETAHSGKRIDWHIRFGLNAEDRLSFIKMERKPAAAE